MTTILAPRMAQARRYESLVLLGLAFAALVIVGLVSIDGFTSRTNVISILLLSSFLGIAAIGQTLVALVGGIDISIPFVITASNIALAKFLESGWGAPEAIAVVFFGAALVGALNGVLSWTLKVHPLLVSLGIGFALVGAVAIWYSNAQSGAPQWLVKLSSHNGETFGVAIPPLVIIWLVLAAIVIFALRYTPAGRAVYASGDSPLAADRMHVRRRAIWISLFTISALTAAAAGILLLGFTGAGSITVGDPYLLTTIAAVIVGGTTLLGGAGGYGRTAVGALLLGVLSTLLVGFGVEPRLQQTVLGLIILAMVSLYAREEHPRNRV